MHKTKRAVTLLAFLLPLVLTGDTETGVLFKIFFESCFQTHVFALMVRNGHPELQDGMSSAHLSIPNFEYIRQLGFHVHPPKRGEAFCTSYVTFSGEQGDMWECIIPVRPTAFVRDVNHIAKLISYVISVGSRLRSSEFDRQTPSDAADQQLRGTERVQSLSWHSVEVSEHARLF